MAGFFTSSPQTSFLLLLHQTRKFIENAAEKRIASLAMRLPQKNSKGEQKSTKFF